MEENKNAKYNIVFEEGCNCTIHNWDVHDNAGPIYIDTKKKEDEKIAENQENVLTSIEKLKNCIEKMEQVGIIAYKYDYAVIRKVMQDLGFDVLTIDDYCNLVGSMDCVPNSHRPSASTIKAAVFKSASYPNIMLDEYNPEKNAHVKVVADAFYGLFKTL